MQVVDAGNLVKKLIITQKLVKLKRKLLMVIIVISILLLKDLKINSRKLCCKIKTGKFNN